MTQPPLNIHPHYGAEAQARWTQALNDFVESNVLHPRGFSDEESTARIYAFVNSIGDLLNDAAKRAKVRDTWQEQKFYLNVQGVTVLMQSERTKSGFNLGFDAKGFYFQFSPVHLENMRFMGDDFWAVCMELLNLPGADVVIHEWAAGDLAKDTRKRLNNHKSKLFTLMREYFLHELVDYEIKASGFADWEFYWPMDVQRAVLMEQLTPIFKSVWKMDYQLWQVSYQRDNKLKRPLKR